MDWNTDLYHRCMRLQRTSSALRDKSAAVLLECAHTQVPIPVEGGAIYDVPLDPHDAAMEALRLVRALIDPFPLNWQVAIVKALTARTIVKAHDQARPAAAVISA